MLYKIQNEFIKLTVNSKGAEKTSLIFNNKEYLHQPDEYWNRTAPFLFPNVGRLKDNKTIINGMNYELPQHGFLRDQEFELFHSSDNELSLLNVYNDDTLKKYPYKYKVIITYSLKKKNLRTSILITNEDMLDMHFNFGGHPGYNVPIYEEEKFEDYKIVFEKKETFNAPLVTGDGLLDFTNKKDKYKNIDEIILDYKYFETDAIVIPRVKSSKVKLINKENKGLEFSFRNFITLAIWTRPNGKYICLEPWIGYADRHDSNQHFKDKDNIVVLKPLEEFSIYYDTTILD